MRITEEYRALNAQLHAANPAYGTSGAKSATVVIAMCRKLGTRSVLDYGCGKGNLQAALDFPIREYDPAIPGKDALPTPADIVVCGDVLEHIEPRCLDDVLADLARVTRRAGYFIVHTGPALKTLPDGRNTHLIQRDKTWWAQTLEQFFKLVAADANGVEARFIVTPLSATEQTHAGDGNA